MQQESGEIKPIGQPWANATASVLYSFADYALIRGKAFYDTYKDQAYACFNWIVATRRESDGDPRLVPGLFPPLQGCDWEEVFQSWTMADLYNCRAEETLAQAAERYKDERAPTIRDEANDYHKLLVRLTEQAVARDAGRDELHIPITPDGNDQQLYEHHYPYFYHGLFFCFGLLDPAEIPRVVRHLTRQGKIKNHLYAHLIRRDGNTHIWYTSFADYYWFRAFLLIGDRAEAEAILDAQLRYSMTNEFYMIERFADNDPWHLPWSPNASANGRTALMLLELYQDTEPKSDR